LSVILTLRVQVRMLINSNLLLLNSGLIRRY
jgi:hypothetical protein